MSGKEKAGVVAIILLLGLLAMGLYLTVRPLSSQVNDPADSVIVKQRMINLQKGN